MLKLLNEPSLPVVRKPLSGPLLEDESDIVVAPPAPLNAAAQTPVTQSDELAVNRHGYFAKTGRLFR